MEEISSDDTRAVDGGGRRGRYLFDHGENGISFIRKLRRLSTHGQNENKNNNDDYNNKTVGGVPRAFIAPRRSAGRRPRPNATDAVCAGTRRPGGHAHRRRLSVWHHGAPRINPLTDTFARSTHPGSVSRSSSV